jgi:hypothetical protein
LLNAEQHLCKSSNVVAVKIRTGEMFLSLRAEGYFIARRAVSRLRVQLSYLLSLSSSGPISTRAIDESRIFRYAHRKVTSRPARSAAQHFLCFFAANRSAGDVRPRSAESSIALACARRIHGARRILVVFLFAVLFASLLEPLVSLVQHRSKLSRGSRALAILQVYLILLLIMSAGLLGIGPRVGDEGRKLAAALPGLLDQISSWTIVTHLGEKHGWSFETQTRVQQFLGAHREAIITWARDFGSRATILLTNVVWLIVIPILAIFFLRDGREFADSVIHIAWLSLGTQRH